MKRREIVVVIIASYLLNIFYNVYWFVQTSREITAALDDEASIPRVWSVFKPFLIGIALFAFAQLLIWTGRPGSAQHNPYLIGLLTLLFLVFLVVTIVMSVRFLWRYCHALARLVPTVDGTTIFWVWLLCSLLGFTVIGVAWAQYEINKYIEGGQSSNAPTTP